MALAEFFNRNATAVAQVLSQFEEESFIERLEGAHVGIGFSSAAKHEEGKALLDCLVRLLARLYPSISIRSGRSGERYVAELTDLARSINPRIETHEHEALLEIAVGEGAPVFAPTVFYVGSRGWDALLSVLSPQPVGCTHNPFGAGAAACFACANVFRAVFLDEADNLIDKELSFSVLERQASLSARNLPLEHLDCDEDVVLAGVGAIGNGALWALSRLPGAGKVHLVDPQEIERSNLQRYLLTVRSDEGAPKVDVAHRYFAKGIQAECHQVTWASFVETAGYRWRRVLVALDSARDRRAVQASLPYWIANAWTQPGDLGLSTHHFANDGACLNCLYLPQGDREHEDAIIANALGVPERLMQIRALLYQNAGAPRELLGAVAERLQVPEEKVLAFEGRPLRSLYVEGICGGVVLPLGRVGAPRPEVHVPLAHQSALAGILLAGALVADVLGVRAPSTLVTRINLLRPLATYLTQPVQKDSRGICLCQDPDYTRAYQRKYGE
jgi:hypothetical protein